MQWLLYLRLFYLTAGTLLAFFWMVVILGHRRQRNFERVFFFLCLALVAFFGSSLLALNAQIYYGNQSQPVSQVAWILLCVGLWFIPALVLHLHAEYASLREVIRSRRTKWIWLAGAYLPAILLSPYLLTAIRLKDHQDFQRPTHLLGVPFQVWLVVSVALAALWQTRFSKVAASKEEKSLYKMLKWQFIALTALLIVSVWLQQRFNPDFVAFLAPTLLVVTILGPFLTIIEQVNRFNFLAIGRQRNLMYAVFAVFLALLYLSLVHRLGQWFELYMPPEATAGLLLFLPVVFFEPLQRILRGLLRQTAQVEVDRAQKLMGPINDVARLGDYGELARFAERWIAEQLQLAVVELELSASGQAPTSAPVSKSNSEEVFPIVRSGRYLGELRVRAHGAMVSGETYAALEFVAEQLPATFDLCRLIEEKLQLERELAERERMALVGQMAASISHNLKNPLGSIKTILQVQMESPEMPASLSRETQMVLDEVNRLSARLNQLLQFSRPGLRAVTKGDHCNVVSVARDVVEVLRHEAAPGGISLEFADSNGACEVAGSGEALNDILSNVVLNAIEAAGRGGHVRLCLQDAESSCTVAVEDDGPGIPATIKEKIVKPFFTTKARGTGLGLAIVARRLEEIGGELQIDSPIREERGSRFRVILPLAEKETAR
jgi:signal transduction histidine kinase